MHQNIMKQSVDAPIATPVVSVELLGRLSILTIENIIYIFKLISYLLIFVFSHSVCVSISAGCCSGTVTSNLCPGSSDIKCCTNNPCSTPSGSGTCKQTSACSGTSVPGYCTGPSDLQVLICSLRLTFLVLRFWIKFRS